MAQSYSPDEPARQPDYRRTYKKMMRRQDEVDDGLSALYKIVSDLRDRVRHLEAAVKKIGPDRP